MADLLQVSVSDSVRNVLDLAQQSNAINEEDKSAAEAACIAGTIDWRILRRLCDGLRGAQSGGPWLHELCKESKIFYGRPKERKRSPELENRIKCLQDLLDNKRYNDMVADITKKERHSQDTRNKVLPTFRLQASFGLHVITTMGTLFAVGYYCGKMLFRDNTTMAAMTGTIGMTGGLLVETTLLILRSNQSITEKKFMRQEFAKGSISKSAAKTSITASVGIQRKQQ